MIWNSLRKIQFLKTQVNIRRMIRDKSLIVKYTELSSLFSGIISLLCFPPFLFWSCISENNSPLNYAWQELVGIPDSSDANPPQTFRFGPWVLESDSLSAEMFVKQYSSKGHDLVHDWSNTFKAKLSLN